MSCQQCHACRGPIKHVLNGVEYCPKCQQYQRPLSHGYTNPSPSEAEQAPCHTASSSPPPTNEPQSCWHDADVIHTYSRQQAIEDGTLVEIPRSILAEFGIRFHTALTRAVWNKYVTVPAVLTGIQDETGRLADILVMFHLAAKHARPDSTQLMFQVVVKQDATEQPASEITLKAIVDAGDDGKGAITILLENED